MNKKETLEEYLARGGVITKCPPQEEPVEELKVASIKGSASQMMSLSDGGLYYAESKAKPKVNKRKAALKSINFAALPASLMKFVLNDNA